MRSKQDRNVLEEHNSRIKRQLTLRELTAHEFRKFMAFGISLISDLARGVSVILALSVFYGVLQIARAFGLDGKSMDALERLDFWINYAIIFVVGFDFLFRLVRAIRLRGTND